MPDCKLKLKKAKGKRLLDLREHVARNHQQGKIRVISSGISYTVYIKISLAF